MLLPGSRLVLERRRLVSCLHGLVTTYHSSRKNKIVKTEQKISLPEHPK